MFRNKLGPHQIDWTQPGLPFRACIKRSMLYLTRRGHPRRARLAPDACLLSSEVKRLSTSKVVFTSSRMFFCCREIQTLALLLSRVSRFPIKSQLSAVLVRETSAQTPFLERRRAERLTGKVSRAPLSRFLRQIAAWASKNFAHSYRSMPLFKFQAGWIKTNEPHP